MAVSDPGGILATPLTIIEYDDEAVALRGIVDIIVSYQVDRVIAGLPRSMDGSIGRQAEKVQAFVSRLAGQTSVPIEFRDERFSTVTARNLMKTMGKGAQKGHDDAVAAAVILQSYLDEKLPGME